MTKHRFHPAKVGALLLMICLLFAIYFAVRAGISNIAFFQAEKAVVRPEETNSLPTLEQVTAAEEAITVALDYWAENPDYLSLAGQIQGWKGFLLAEKNADPEVGQPYYGKALNFLRRSLELRPAHAKTWALLAEYKIMAGERDDEWLRARDKALELGGGDIRMVDRMMRL